MLKLQILALFVHTLFEARLYGHTSRWLDWFSNNMDQSIDPHYGLYGLTKGTGGRCGGGRGGGRCVDGGGLLVEVVVAGILSVVFVGRT